ncbi:phosphonate ABC transporter ATP-binding protein [Teichococcus vastitatis]|uniref:ATP-binding cassette domain-containing protein n=1 Tax=Teichococcus vastitatis TaxID=2307076 RepID=A0ABS9W7C2_9PROT|nr:ATP-binding cassette domain-containing protein [Pseudoroseomonas vastitatis]MCI0755132.1 ATP-binding cassette domain-containing protein [Pseudoroseomonas vastitatis]
MSASLAERTEPVAIPPPVLDNVPVPDDVVVRNLSIAYGAAAPVLRGVSFAVRRGETVALIGANGAGKSTLLKACLGLVPPGAGEVQVLEQVFGGRALRRSGPREALRTIGFVAQKHNLVLRLSVLSNVLHGFLAQHPGPRCWLQATAPAALRQRALQVLDRVGLAHLAARRADTLSGGQQQRVAIARALVNAPRLIFADEPAASLDPAVGEEVMQIFTRTSRETGTTLIFTTHHLDHARRHAQRVLGLKAGMLVIDAPVDRLQREELHGFYD